MELPELDFSILEEFYLYYTFLSRFLLPLLAGIILLRCLQSLLRERYEPEIWGYLSLPNASKMALYHWENLIGRAQSADVSINYPSLSRNHLALIRDDKAQWTAIDLDSKAGVTVNGTRIHGRANVKKGDVLGLGGVEVALLDLRPEELGVQSITRTKPGLWYRPSGTFFFLTLFQLLLAIQHAIVNADDFAMQIFLGFGAFTAMMWGYFFFVRAMGRTGFEAEALAFLLCSISMSVIASATPDELLWTAAMIFAGILFFVFICYILRDLRRAKHWRWPIAIAGVIFLAVGFIFAEEVHGARRWIEMFGITVQPSEFVKVAFIFAGAASLERLFARQNLFFFIAYSGLCMVILALMRDFGSAAVFFTTFLVIAFLRSGDVATIALSLASLVFAGFLVLMVQPHVATRFDTWGNVWDDPFGRGFQQVRTLSSTASGGLFGLGGGNGTLRDVFAADADMVFGVISEELGLIVAIICIAAIVVLGIFAIRSSSTARSSFYVIAAGAAVTMFLTQTILTVFGPLDVIPFTGITFPFISRGGSSMLASWGLLAFLKAVDTRQNASLAVPLDRRAIREAKRGGYVEYDEYGNYDDVYEEADYDEYEEDKLDESDYPEPLDGGIDAQYFDGDPWQYSDDEWEGRR